MTPEKTTFTVRGMTCNSCVRHVTQALRSQPGVTEVDVQLAEGTACVLHDPEETSRESLRQAIEEAGYEAQ